MKFTRATWLLAACALAAVVLATMRPPRSGDVPAAAGDGAVVTESRPLAADVTAVTLDGPINLTLRQGAAPALAVRAEARLLPNIATTVEGDRLRIAPRGMLLRPRQPIDVTVTLPRLASLHATGSGASTASGFAGARLDLALDGSGSLRFEGRYASAALTLRGSGALDYAAGAADRITLDAIGTGNATLAGTARDLHARLLGTGELDAAALQADDVTLVQQGSANARVHARRTASLDLSGSGNVVVTGNPPHRNVQRVGSGDVTFGQ